MTDEIAVGRVVEFRLSPSRQNRAGRYFGYVRRVIGRCITVQCASNPDAVSVSARYRGSR